MHQILEHKINEDKEHLQEFNIRAPAPLINGPFMEKDIESNHPLSFICAVILLIQLSIILNLTYKIFR